MLYVHKNKTMYIYVYTSPFYTIQSKSAMINKRLNLITSKLSAHLLIGNFIAMTPHHLNIKLKSTG